MFEMTRERIEDRIPWYTMDTLNAYVQRHVMGSGWFWYLLTNDLVSCVLAADGANLAALRDISMWLYNYAPSDCYGTPGKVRAWLRRKPKKPKPLAVPEHQWPEVKSAVHASLQSLMIRRKRRAG